MCFTCKRPLRHHRHHGHRRSRTRGRTAGGDWDVKARIERVGEPLLLLLLRQRPAHGYELIERLGEALPGERVDMGNLYRVLRALEDDGVVASEWRDDVPGPAKRTYELTDEGAKLLEAWARALGDARATIDDFLTRYTDEGGEHVPRR